MAVKGHRAVSQHPAEGSSVTSANQRPSGVPWITRSQAPEPQQCTPGRAGHLGRAASPPFRFRGPLRGDYSSFWTLRHTSWQQHCKAAPGVSICIIAGQEPSFQSGPCPCL